MHHKSKQADHDRGFKVCDICKTKAHVFNAGTDCDSWQQCKRCDSWVVDKEEFEDVEIGGKLI